MMITSRRHKKYEFNLKGNKIVVTVKGNIIDYWNVDPIFFMYEVDTWIDCWA